MHITAHGISDRGLVREVNEDALFIDEDHCVYAVADDLGGLPGGDQASGRIVELLDTTFNGVDSCEERVDLADLIIEINRIVTKEGLEAHPFTGAGSTLTIGQIVKDQLLVAHVGDRILLCTDGLNKVLTDRQIQFLLEVDQSPEFIAQSLVDSANANQGPDNITIIVLIIE